MLHTLLDNSRLDGEYCGNGNETRVDAVSDFIAAYHPEAQLIGITDEAATGAVHKKNSQRIYTEVVPKLDELSIRYSIAANGNGARFKLGEYTLALDGRTSGRSTLTISSKSKTTEETLADFEHSQELSANSAEDSSRKARIPLSNLELIFESIAKCIQRRCG